MTMLTELEVFGLFGVLQKGLKKEPQFVVPDQSSALCLRSRAPSSKKIRPTKKKSVPRERTPDDQPQIATDKRLPWLGVVFTKIANRLLLFFGKF